MRTGALFLPVLAGALSSCGSRTGLSADDTHDAAAVIEAEAPQCGPATCGGCCDEAGACHSGTTTEACGLGGADCQTCNPLFDICNPTGGGTQVLGVVCWVPCDFVKGCQTGCCTPAGECLPGNAPDACGTRVVCQDCAAQGKVCGTTDERRACVGP